jgi:histidine triad (HIT) family protein
LFAALKEGSSAGVELVRIYSVSQLNYGQNAQIYPTSLGDQSLHAMTIFEKIIARQIPAKIIWEDDDAVAFHDVNPQAPVHVLIVPKKVVPRLADAKDDDRALLGKLLLVARDLAKKLELASGYRVVINCGPDAGESVPHLHVHLLGKRALAWPPG